MLFVLQQEMILLTDYRYAAIARDSVPGLTVVNMATDPDHPYATIGRIAAGFDHPRFRTDGSLELFRQMAPQAETEPLGDMIIRLRACKSKEEIAFIAKACEITDGAFCSLLNWIRPGLSEREIAIRLEYEMKCAGADQPMAYDIVVASGKRSAYAHAHASRREIEASDAVLLDFGCKYEGYCSDLSRTLFMGRATELQRTVYQTVLTAQEACIGMLRAGVDSALIDRTAFEVCAEAGFGDQYGMGVGHGVGLSIAEAPVMLDAPGFAVRVPICENAVLTIEPAIYLDGQFGVRIEDVLHVTADGAVNLVHAAKERTELGFS